MLLISKCIGMFWVRNGSCPTGLIIDAFGELRDQQEQVREDMEVRL